jgi:ParB-like chromosome segregation protein Spo0J
VEIRVIPITQIKPAKYNPRKDLHPGDPEYQKIKQSIKEFGLVEPLIWNERTGNLVGGHQRLKVLIEQGVNEVECSVVDLDDKAEKALNVAVNKIGGEWDIPKLAELINDIDGDGFDVQITGFDQNEIDKLMASLSPIDLDEDKSDNGKKDTSVAHCPKCGFEFEVSK